MTIADVIWSRDHHGKPVLELKLDGHPAYIRSSQKAELTRRGIVEGLVFLTSERSAQLPNIFITGDFAPDYSGLDLVGCTDDSQVFALYQSMVAAIRADRWHEGAQPVAS
jgi:hypothetical protein